MKKYLAECIGTFLLIMVGCGTALFEYNTVGVLGVALAIGLTYILCFYTICKNSGCHLNPVLTFALWLFKKVNNKDFINYIISQFIGAILASGVLFILLTLCGNAQQILTTFNGITGFDDFSISHISAFGAFCVEIILTATFVLTYLCTCTKNKDNSSSGVIVGIVYCAIVIFGYNLTGACINPARGLASSLFFAYLNQPILLLMFLVFLFSTFAGSIIAVIIFRYFYKENCDFIKLPFTKKK